jgi:hypothetical protein
VDNGAHAQMPPSILLSRYFFMHNCSHELRL